MTAVVYPPCGTAITQLLSFSHGATLKEQARAKWDIRILVEHTCSDAPFIP